MGVKRAVTATLIEAGTDAGKVILPGGVDVEVGTLPLDLRGVTSLAQSARLRPICTRRTPEPAGPSSLDRFAQSAARRGGSGRTWIGHRPDLGAGSGRGVHAKATPNLQSAPIGTAQAATTCGTSNATNDYSELYSQSARTWTVGPSFASGFNPANSAAFAVLP